MRLVRLLLIATLVTIGQCEKVEALAFANKIKPKMKEDLEKSMQGIAKGNLDRVLETQEQIARPNQESLEK